jgi:hypothetical protein
MKRGREKASHHVACVCAAGYTHESRADQQPIICKRGTPLRVLVQEQPATFDECVCAKRFKIDDTGCGGLGISQDIYANIQTHGDLVTQTSPDLLHMDTQAFHAHDACWSQCLSCAGQKSWQADLLCCSDGHQISYTLAGAYCCDDESCRLNVLRSLDKHRMPNMALLDPKRIVSDFTRNCIGFVESLECRIWMVQLYEERELHLQTVPTAALLLYNLVHSPKYAWPVDNGRRRKYAYMLMSVCVYIAQKFYVRERKDSLDALLIYSTFLVGNGDQEAHYVVSNCKAAGKALCAVECAILQSSGNLIAPPTVQDYVEMMWYNWFDKQHMSIEARLRLRDPLLDVLQRGLLSMYICPSFVRTDLCSSSELAVKYLRYAIPVLTHGIKWEDRECLITAKLPHLFDSATLNRASLLLFESILGKPLCTSDAGRHHARILADAQTATIEMQKQTERDAAMRETRARIFDLMTCKIPVQREHVSATVMQQGRECQNNL